MKYLVTGGAGFIGSNIVEALLKMDEEVKVFDNFSTGKTRNLSDLERMLKKGIQLIEGDIRDLSKCFYVMRGVDYVLHQAALPSVARSIENPLISNEVNINGTLNLLIAAKESKVKRFVYASSSSVYGDTPIMPRHEDLPTSPISPYATTKLCAELYTKVFHKIYGLETVSLRYFNIFGPRQDPTSQYSAVIPRFITAMLDGKRPIVYGDGTQSRDFTHVENVVRANLDACTAKDVAGRVFNIGCGGNFSLLELLDTLSKIMNKNVDPEFTDPRPGDVKKSIADISRAKKYLGYEPKVGFRDGLEKTIEYFKSQKQR